MFVLGHINIRRKRRATEGTQINLHHTMLLRRDRSLLRRTLQLNSMALTVAKRHGIHLKALRPRHRHCRGGIQSAAQQNHCFF